MSSSEFRIILLIISGLALLYRILKDTYVRSTHAPYNTIEVEGVVFHKEMQKTRDEGTIFFISIIDNKTHDGIRLKATQHQYDMVMKETEVKIKYRDFYDIIIDIEILKR